MKAEILWNDDGTGWIRVESIETLNVMPVNDQGELSMNGSKAGLFADRSNGELFLVAVRPTVDEAVKLLHEIAKAMGFESPEESL